MRKNLEDVNKVYAVLLQKIGEAYHLGYQRGFLDAQDGADISTGDVATKDFMCGLFRASSVSVTQ